MTRGHRFLIRFVVCIAVLYALIAIPPVNDHVIVPYTAALARVVAAACSAVGMQALFVKTVVYGDSGFAMNIENGCNGVEAVVLLLAAVAAFPAPWIERAKGILYGLVFIQIVNVLRLVMLYWLGVYHRRWFDLFHVTVWQTVIVLITLAFFFVWSSRVADRTTTATAG